MKHLLYRYRILIIILFLNFLLYLIIPTIGEHAATETLENLKELLLIMPPIFILLGFLDVWIDKETMMKFMGENSGIRGIFIAFVIGSFAAGPGYMAFPFAEVLMSKGAKFTNIIIFIGAWSATKVPISLFEASIMGWPFMLLRYALDVPAILLIAKFTDLLLSKYDKAKIYQKFNLS
jgi:uncharacterized membrane protein YraQ (UPF0718 family)